MHKSAKLLSFFLALLLLSQWIPAQAWAAAAADAPASVSKAVNGTTTEFFLNGSQVLAQKTGDSVMRFFYDSTGKRVGFANGTMLFYYLYNVQGDVIAIVRAATGQIVAKYSYDAWGKCTVTNATGYAVGDKNPFRYRGYYYDTETGLYYLNSRYYNPEFGRFISSDGFVSTGQGITGSNMFAYCGNNPINRYDPSGNSFLGIAAGAVILKYLAAFAASALLLIGFNNIVNNPPASPPITIPKFEFKSESTEKAEEKDKPAAIPSQPNTTIYRYGGTNPGNLTPREKDKYTGLSFSTIPLPGAAETTIEALNSTGVVYAIRDGKTHVSVRPVGGSMQDWIDAGAASIWTQAVKSVVVKWDGVN